MPEQELAPQQLNALVKVYDLLFQWAGEDEPFTLVEGQQYLLDEQMLTATFNAASGHWELLEQAGQEQVTRYMVAPDDKLMPVELDEGTGSWVISQEPSRWVVNDLKSNFNQD